MILDQYNAPANGSARLSETNDRVLHHKRVST